VEQHIVQEFGKGDDILMDFDFTPIHIAALNLYDTNDKERPNLEQ
jgi:hypothetical protein